MSGVMKVLSRLAAILVAVLSVLYVGSYLALSALGHYAVVLPPAGHKEVRWAPKGFVEFPTGPVSSAYDFKWNRGLLAFYGPLYRLDDRFWHRPQATLTL